MEELLLVPLLAVLWVVSFYLSAYLVKRAVSQVIEKFCRRDALGFRNAKTLEELGLEPRDPLQAMFRLRDYKPLALRALTQAGIIQMTEEGKYYLAEERLNENLKCRNYLFAPVEP